jgi:hypothetical protein
LSKAVEPFAPSLLIVRQNGKLSVEALSESADPALQKLESYRKAKERANDVDVLPIIRGKTTRKLRFTA